MMLFKLIEYKIYALKILYQYIISINYIIGIIDSYCMKECFLKDSIIQVKMDFNHVYIMGIKSILSGSILAYNL